MFLDHTQRRSTVGRNPLDEWSASRRDLYLTTHDTHNRQISMPPVEFEPTISAGERPQAAHLLKSWVQIPRGACIFVCCECRVLSGRGLCDELITRPEESYRMCCVVECDLETSRMGAPYIFDISRLRVNSMNFYYGSTRFEYRQGYQWFFSVILSECLYNRHRISATSLKKRRYTNDKTYQMKTSGQRGRIVYTSCKRKSRNPNGKRRTCRTENLISLTYTGRGVLLSSARFF